MKYKKLNTPVWLVSEAKSQLSEILRCARTRGPQIIGSRNQCVVVSREEWEEKIQATKPFSSWLVDNSPGVELELPKRGQSSSRSVPFHQD
ncbi:MAG: type II toxin-antitoxin system prevent-host-death family antitoxin [Verrucomicrobia bacterium]|nr:type II toxin-antitoxin system prevent-host-death family antitoxin [Verrucomicrobiota bacterium]